MWEQIEANKRRTFFVMLFMSLLFAVFGGALGYYFIGDIDGIVILGFIFLFILIVMLINAKSIALSTLGEENLYKCNETNAKQLLNIVSEMKIASGLSKMPEVYILDTNIMNAFACAPNIDNASIVVTKGLLEALDRDELQGVIAHEMAHIVNRDTTYLLYASIIVTLISIMARIFYRSSSRRSSSSSSKNSNGNAIFLILLLVLAILAPILSRMLYFLLSRKREYLADACAAQYTRYPMGLALALKKISKGVYSYDEEDEILEKINSDSNPFVSASCIIPFAKNDNEKDGLFSTHPSTSNRISILLQMAGENVNAADFLAYENAYKRVVKKGGLIPKSSLEKAKKIPQRASTVGAMGLVETDLNKDKEVSNRLEELKHEKNQNSEEKLKRRRNVEDMMWKMADYTFIECPCKTKLKIPSSYKNSNITCPHCGKVHRV